MAFQHDRLGTAMKAIEPDARALFAALHDAIALGLACFGAEWQNVGHLLVALDISRFGSVSGFKQRMDALIGQIRSSRLAPGVDAIYLPGELEYRRAEERRRDGVPIEAGRFGALAALGDDLGVPTTLDRVVAA